jgi:aryl-alcohol dehydrogenase-like predicted oxidoreductase
MSHASGPELTRLGLGTWAFSGPYEFGLGPQDDKDSTRAIQRAVEAGINWIDTADVYGLGHAEEVVRRALKPHRTSTEVLVFTKCGRSWHGTEDRRIVYDLAPLPGPALTGTWVGALDDPGGA